MIEVVKKQDKEVKEKRYTFAVTPEQKKKLELIQNELGWDIPEMLRKVADQIIAEAGVQNHQAG